MPVIKHQVDIYFNLRARGESCRLLLAYGGLQYEDERLPPAKLEDPSVWARVKQTTPWGQLPVLTRGGVKVVQSMATARCKYFFRV